MRRVTDVTPFTAFHFTFDDESLMIGFRIFFPAPKKYPILTPFSRGSLWMRKCGPYYLGRYHHSPKLIEKRL